MHLTRVFVTILIGCSGSLRADSTEARCDVYPAGSDQTDVMIPRSFSQRQGYVTVRRSDGIVHELSPVQPGYMGCTLYRRHG
jgi:hypothetical protein